RPFCEGCGARTCRSHVRPGRARRWRPRCRRPRLRAGLVPASGGTRTPVWPAHARALSGARAGGRDGCRGSAAIVEGRASGGSDAGASGSRAAVALGGRAIAIRNSRVREAVMDGWLIKIGGWEGEAPIRLFAAAEADPRLALVAVQKI